MSKHRCFEVMTPAGHTALVHGNPEMPQATFDALMRMMDLAYQQFSAIQMLDGCQESDGEPSAPSTISHNCLGALCAVSTCGLKRSGRTRYCKKHDMRFRRGNDPAVDRPRGRPGKERA